MMGDPLKKLTFILLIFICLINILAEFVYCQSQGKNVIVCATAI